MSEDGSAETPKYLPEEAAEFAPPGPADVPHGQYANVVAIGATQWEFVLDFVMLETSAYPDQSGPSMRPVARIILSPQNIKGVHGALGDAIRRYETMWRSTLPDMRTVQPAAIEKSTPPQADSAEHAK